MSYVPASRWVTFVPSAFFREMLKPGPTTPVRVAFGALVAAVGMETATTARMPMSSVRNIRPSLGLLTAERANRFSLRGRAARNDERPAQPRVPVGTVAVRAGLQVDTPGRPRLGGDLRLRVQARADEVEVLRGRPVADDDAVRVRLEHPDSLAVGAHERDRRPGHVGGQLSNTRTAAPRHGATRALH